MTREPAVVSGQTDPEAIVERLRAEGVLGVTIAYVDNNGIARSRTVPTPAFAAAAHRGVGVTTLFAVFDSRDAITFAHPGLANASGDVRLVPVLDRLLPRLSGQPRFGWAPGVRIQADGSPWAYDDRSVLVRQVDAARALGYEFRAGYEIEFFLGRLGEDLGPAHAGPAYGPKATLEVDEFLGTALSDLAANGVPVAQIHAEYGLAQLELSIEASDPLTAADHQVLARQTIHAAARRHGLRASFAPVVTMSSAGNGWHLHTSTTKDGVPVLDGGPDGPGPLGRAYIGGLLRELPAIAAVTAPSVGSRLRLRPGFFAGAYAAWGVENREAPLRYIPTSEFMGVGHANLELKTSDASANPFLALAVVIAAAVAGMEQDAPLPAPVSSDPGSLSDAERSAAGIVALPATEAEAAAALSGSALLRSVLGEDLYGAFAAVRASDAAWAESLEPEEIAETLRWRY